MWTPKRIMLLVVGFLMFTLAYLLYSATTLGRINTLPPLPDYYQVGGSEDEAKPRIVTGPSSLEKKMERAFGAACRELKWPVQLELNAKSMVMAAGMFEVVEDGRMRLEPMSIGLFGKKKNDGRDVEINTLRCKQAYITFDRPVTSLSPTELSGRKIVKAELFGDPHSPIVLVNNRRTAQRDDDLWVTIPTGPLYYYEKNQLIRTNDQVHLTDGQLTPPKADIVAKGMEMDLATAAPPPKPGVGPHKPKNESISGVKRIVLKQDVTMHLYVAGATPFPGGDKTRATPTPKTSSAPAGRSGGNPAPETSHVIIGTPGRFQYDIFKDHDMAHFDVPEGQDQPHAPQDVTVQRINERLGMNDQLVRKHLELRLKRRDDSAPAAGGPAAAQQTEQSLEIETAHATGPEVTLTSDAEKLDAHCNDLFYDAAKKLTILKGAPYMEANKDDSLIQAPELRIQDIPLPARVPPAVAGSDKGAVGPSKTYQQVHAKGPGSIHMINKSTRKQTVHAFWNDKLISTRDGELDLLILIGSARFVDDEHKQSLRAETLKVWLLAEEKKAEAMTVKAAPKAPTAAKTSAAKASGTPLTPEQGRRPHHLEALRNVLLQSPEMTIHDASRFVVRFTDVPASRMPPPPAGGDKKPLQNQPGAPATGVANPTPLLNKPGAPAKSVANPSLALPASGVAQPGPRGVAPAKAAPEPERPIDLTARSIEAEVLRCGERSVLDHLWAEGGSIDNRGGVKVHQDPTRSGEQGVHIEGNTLDMKCYPEGNMLVVTGDLAQLEMDKILILGPEVNIDQAKNKAWVYGEGAMRMQSNTTLEGKPLGRTVPLIVHWSQDMLFDGKFAEFSGGIQAEQESARLACQRLQVFFDRPISLKEGAKGDQPAKVRNLVGDKDVRVEDSVVEQNKLLKYQLLEGTWIAMSTVPRDEVPPVPGGKSSDANEVRLSGPGSVRIMQRGGEDLSVSPGRPSPRPSGARPPAAGDQEMKLTYVSFQKLMKASSRTNTADFWEAVRVLTLPCDDPHREIDLDSMLATELPPGAMYMRCNRLKVLSEQVRGKTNQQMEAHGQVDVQAREFWAKSDHMTYNEAKDQIIFTGEGDNLATLAKIIGKGVQPEVLRARKIIYIRSTGAANVGDVDSFTR